MLTDQTYGDLELVATFDGPMPTGVTVSQSGRIFVNYPEWGDHPEAKVAELRDGRIEPYPDPDWNTAADKGDATAFVSPQSVVVDPYDRLWALDTGAPNFEETEVGGPKMVCVDLHTDTVHQTITFDRDVAPPTTYLNDVRFDMRRGEAGTAYVTDSAVAGANGIIVVDLATGEAWRRLASHPSTKAESIEDYRPVIEGRYLMFRRAGQDPEPVTIGTDGIAISAKGERLFYCPLMSRHLYSVSVDALTDRSVSDEALSRTVRHEGDKGSAGDGMESDDAGRIYMTAYEQDAVLRRNPDGEFETVVHDPRLLWPDTLSVATDGYLYVTANQFHRQAFFHNGRDEREQPYALFRTPIDAGPVLLR